MDVRVRFFPLFLLLSLFLSGCSEDLIPEFTFAEYRYQTVNRLPGAVKCGEARWLGVGESTGPLSRYTDPEVINCIRSMQANAMSAYAFVWFDYPDSDIRSWHAIITSDGDVHEIFYRQNLQDETNLDYVENYDCIGAFPSALSEPRPLELFRCNPRQPVSN